MDNTYILFFFFLQYVSAVRLIHNSFTTTTYKTQHCSKYKEHKEEDAVVYLQEERKKIHIPHQHKTRNAVQPDKT
jgi:hypothetical protein